MNTGRQPRWLRATRRRPRPLNLEALEDRRLLTRFVVTDPGDTSATYFGTTVTIPTGPNTFADAIATGDFDGDGDADIVTGGNNVSFGVQELTFLFNLGDGTFAAPRTFTLGSSSGSFFPSVPIAVGDLNGDRFADVVAGTTDPQVTPGLQVVLSNGDGTFRNGAFLQTADTPTAVVLGDFTGSGRLDIVEADASEIEFFENDGVGNFAPLYTIGNSPATVQNLAVGDLDGRNGPDVVGTGSALTSLSIFLNDGTGFLAPSGAVALPGSSSTPYPAALGDFNADGDLDAAVSYNTDSGPFFAVLPGNGDGTFGTATQAAGLPAGSLGIDLGDFDGDGTPDLAVPNRSTSQLQILPGNGDATFGAIVPFGTGIGPAMAATADFNGDGVDDAATTNSSGNSVTTLETVGTLRQAIIRSNRNPAADTIAFRLPSASLGSVSPIFLNATLPPVVDPVTIDGYTQPGARPNTLPVGSDAVLSVEVRPATSTVGGVATGLTLLGGGSTVRGLVLNRFGGEAILISGGGGNVVRGNYLGVDRTGTAAFGNGTGLTIDSTAGNTIGGAAPGDRNLISGNTVRAIELVGSGSTGNVILGNRIGTDAAGTTAIGNGEGIDVTAPGNTFGGLAAGAGNLIAGNGGVGLRLLGPTASGNVVQGNLIGTTASGLAPLANRFQGVLISSAPSNTIGGPPAAPGVPGPGRNVISGNGNNGIAVTGSGADGNLIQGNLLGLGSDGLTPVGNAFAGVYLGDGSGFSPPIPGTATTTTIAGNLIGGNLQSGVFANGAASTGNVFRGNYVGVNQAGGAAGNTFSGLFLQGVTANTIGGTTAADRNVIAGNGVDGITISQGATGVVVLGNYIGTTPDGGTPLGNVRAGVRIDESPGNTIGGGTAAAGNVIAGNRAEGVRITGSGATGILIAGNLIGVAADRRAALGNGLAGLSVSGGAAGLTIGGATQDAGNLIANNGAAGSGATAAGVSVAGSGPVLIQFNTITASAGAGVAVATSRAVTILTNSIVANGGPGIQTDPGALPVRPVIGLAPTGGTFVQIRFDGTPNSDFLIQLFLNDRPGFGGFGEGQTFLAQQVVRTDSSGTVVANIAVPSALPAGRLVTATATDLARDGSTSDFSRAFAVAAPATLTINDMSTVVEQGDSAVLVFTVTLSQANVVPVTVAFATADGTAIAPADYTPQAGTLTFPTRPESFLSGPTTLTITVPIVGNPTDPATKTFFVNLANPFGALFGDAQGTGTFTVLPPARVIVGLGNGDDFIIGPVVPAADGVTPIQILVSINGVAQTPIDLTTRAGRNVTIDGQGGDDTFLFRLGNLAAPGFIAGGTAILNVLGNVGGDTFRFESLPNLPNLLVGLDGGAGADTLILGNSARGTDVFAYNVPDPSASGPTPLPERLEFVPRAGATAGPIASFAFRDIANLDPITIDGDVTAVGDYGQGRAFGAGANLNLPPSQRIGVTPGQPVVDNFRANVVGTTGVDLGLQANNAAVPLIPFRNPGAGRLRATLLGYAADDVFSVRLPATFNNTTVQVDVQGGSTTGSAATAGNLLNLELANLQPSNIEVRSTADTAQLGSILSFRDVDSIAVFGVAGQQRTQPDQLTFGASLPTTQVNLGATGRVSRTVYDPLYVELEANNNERHLAVGGQDAGDQADLRLEGSGQTAEVRLARNPAGPFRTLNVTGSGNSTLRLVDPDGGARVVSSQVFNRNSGVLIVQYPGRRGISYTIVYTGMSRIESRIRLAPGVRLPRNLTGPTRAKVPTARSARDLAAKVPAVRQVAARVHPGRLAVPHGPRGRD